ILAHWYQARAATADSKRLASISKRSSAEITSGSTRLDNPARISQISVHGFGKVRQTKHLKSNKKGTPARASTSFFFFPNDRAAEQAVRPAAVPSAAAQRAKNGPAASGRAWKVWDMK